MTNMIEWRLSNGGSRMLSQISINIYSSAMQSAHRFVPVGLEYISLYKTGD